MYNTIASKLEEMYGDPKMWSEQDRIRGKLKFFYIGEDRYQIRMSLNGDLTTNIEIYKNRVLWKDEIYMPGNGRALSVQPDPYDEIARENMAAIENLSH